MFELYVGFESSSDSLVEAGVFSFRSGLLLKLSFVGVSVWGLAGPVVSGVGRGWTSSSSSLPSPRLEK